MMQRSTRRAGAAWLAPVVLAAAQLVAPALAQSPAAPSAPTPAAAAAPLPAPAPTLDAAATPRGPAADFARDCGSVVVKRCATPVPEDPRNAAGRRAAERRVAQGVADLGVIVIEGERVRTPAVEQVLRDALAPPPPPAAPSRTFAIGEGAQCTCKTPCPPPPLPCCACSAPMDRYITSPASRIGN